MSFLVIVAILVAAAVTFIQSRYFAGVIKVTMAQRLPQNLGIDGDFSEISIGLFPPALAIRNPRVTLQKHNVVNLPAGSSINAEKVELVFRPFQMLSGDIRVREVRIVNGDVRLVLASSMRQFPQKKGLKVDLNWDELLNVRADSFSIENTRLHLQNPEKTFSIDMMANSLNIGQWSGAGGLGYRLSFELSGFQSDRAGYFSLASGIDRIKASARVNVTGVEIDALDLSAPSVELHSSGTIKGNVLDPKNLALDLKSEVKGSLEQALKLGWSADTDPPTARGDFVFNGRLRGNPQKLRETLRAEGSIKARHVFFEGFHADEAGAEMAWAAGARGGEIKLERAWMSEAERERVPAKAVGAGGRLEIAAFRFNLADPAPISTQLKLDRAHIDWLLAPFVHKIYPLDLRLTGPLDLVFTPGARDARGKGKWTLQAKLGLQIDDFRLDNQKIGERKPLHKILDIKRFRLDGPVTVNAQQLAFGSDVITLPHSKFTIDGKIDFKRGFDFTGAGPVDLADVGQIAENDIRGVGTLNAHIHGPISAPVLDFDPDVKDAAYLNLEFGDLKGRITWDDDPNHLIFTQAAFDQGRSHYVGNGLIDTEHDQIALDVAIPQGNIQDFLVVFKNLTREISWLPRTLVGDMHGKARISGGIALKQLQVSADVVGSNWEYLGERFRVVNLKGGYDRGKYEVSEFKSIKQAGKVFGRVSYDADRKIDWDLHTQDLTVGDLDHLARLDVPFRGKIKADTHGAGKPGAILSDTSLGLDDFGVRGSSLPPSTLSIHTEKGVAKIEGHALGGEGLLDMTYDSTPGSPDAIHAELHHLDFSPVLLLLNPKSMQDPLLAGLVTGDLQLRFRTGELERASGSGNLSEYLLQKTGARFVLYGPERFTVNDGSFELRELGLRANNGTAFLNLVGRHARIEGNIGGDLDLSLLEFLTPVVGKATGSAKLDFGIDGTLTDPHVFGRATLEGASLRVPSVDSPFENIEGTLALRQNILTVQSLSSELAGGEVDASGTITVFADRYPAINLKASLDGSKIKVYPFQYAKIDGNVEVKGTERPYLVQGAINVESALSKEKVFNQRQTGGLKSMQYSPPPSAQRDTDYPLFKLDIDARADRNILVQNDLFDAELKGKVKIINTLETPRVLGSAEILQGRMLFKDRVFHIQAANATFDNPTVINPSFNLTASTDVNNVKIQLFATGRMDKLKIDLTSNPAMAEPDILSLLALGVTNDDKRITGSDRTVLEQGEAASLLLNSLDFNREVQSKTGLDIQLDESQLPQVGQSIFRPQTQTESATTPRIVVRRKLGSQIDLSYGRTVGQGSIQQNEVNAEVHVTPGFSVLGVWDYYGTGEAKSDTTTSYGMDLKLQKRFK